MLLLSDGWWYCPNYRRLWCLASLVNIGDCRKLQWWTRSRESWLYLMVGAFSLRKEANVICVVLIYFGCGSVPQLIKQFAIDVNFDENDQLNQFRETPWTSAANIVVEQIFLHILFCIFCQKQYMYECIFHCILEMIFFWHFLSPLNNFPANSVMLCPIFAFSFRHWLQNKYGAHA